MITPKPPVKTTRAQRDPIYNLKRELTIRGFSPKTTKSYLYYNTELLKFTRKSPRNINLNDIKEYLYSLKKKNYTNPTINVAINAIKFYYTNILHRNFLINKKVFRTKKSQRLPDILTQQEARLLLNSVSNLKHRLILATIYSSGLRVSEIVKLKVQDLDFNNNIIKIKQAKGDKDRLTILSDKVALILKKYTQDKNGSSYVFENNQQKRMSERAIQKIFTSALKNSELNKQLSCHSLRHSFATHLLENGTDIRYIQKLLGHKRLETTQIYTKVATNMIKNIKSPLDQND